MCMDSTSMSQSRCWHGVAHLQPLWHCLAVVPLGCSQQWLESTDRTMPSDRPHDAVQPYPAQEQFPGSSSYRSRAQHPHNRPGLRPGSSPASPGRAARLPCQRSRLPTAPSKASVSQQWGPIRNEMFLLGYFICTLQ